MGALCAPAGCGLGQKAASSCGQQTDFTVGALEQKKTRSALDCLILLPKLYITLDDSLLDTFYLSVYILKTAGGGCFWRREGNWGEDPVLVHHHE